MRVVVCYNNYMRKCLLLLLGLIMAAGAGWAQSGMDLLHQAKRETEPQIQIKLLTQAVKQAPQLADAYHYRADAYRSLGRYKQALEDYSKTIQLRPRDPFRYYARGLAYLAARQPAQAVADFSKSISLRPSYKKFYVARCRAYLQLEKYEQAIADYQKARFTPPKDELLFEIMPAYVHTFRYEKALALLEASPNTDSAQAHYWRGRIAAGRGDLDEAVSGFSKAINRDESLVPAYRYRANAFKEMGELEASLEDYTALLALQPDALFYNRRGLIEEELGRFKQAREDYSKAIELNPKWAIPFNNRGFVNMHLKDWAGAKRDLETAISLDGTVPTPYINLAGVYWLWKKDRKNAYANLDKALRRNFKDVEALYKEEQKGWMFKGLNQTAQFRALLYK